MKSIAVYCGASKGTNPIYEVSAKRLGIILAAQNIELIYGAGSVGLMGVIANKVLEGGGKALGVIPQFLVDMEVAHKNLSELIIVPTMHERKQIMADRADGVIVLPGGFGTLDEFFEMLRACWDFIKSQLVYSISMAILIFYFDKWKLW